MANLKVIGKVTVGAGGQASIEFTNIPATYTDLLIKISGRFSVDSASAFLRYNGTTTNGSIRWIDGSGTAASSNTDGSNQYGPVHGVVNSTKTANTFGNAEIYIPNYTSSNNKSSSTDGVTENNGTATTMGLGANLWSNTAAITSIQIVPAAGGNFVQYSTAYLYGISSVTTGSKATGGIVSSDGTYYYHMFPYSGTFTPTQSLTADYLVVAGGGGAGFSRAGGGGAGGLRSTVTISGGSPGTVESALSLTAQAYTVTVGAGGTGGTAIGNATNGSNSVFSTITSTGGGKGADGNETNAGNGGSGGGVAYGLGSPGTGAANQGFAGATWANVGGQSNGSGGGGAGAAGSANISGAGGAGGVGVQIYSMASVTQTGVNGYYAGGGGGGGTSGEVSGAGGLGGGGSGGLTNDSSGVAGTTNTGGGGGGGRNQSAAQPGGGGGSGIVIIRYAI